MSLSSWLRNGNAADQRLLLALQDAEDVDHLYAEWRAERIDDYAPVPLLAPVVPIGVARHRHSSHESGAPACPRDAA